MKPEHTTQTPGVAISALSMAQPYAWLFARGHLTIDDRTWSTRYRGVVAIHASKQIDIRYYEFLRKVGGLSLPELDAFEHGGIVGVAQLTDCLARTCPDAVMALSNLHRSHLGVGGHYGLVFESPAPVAFVACRGMPGFFKTPVGFEPNVLDFPALSQQPNQPQGISP